MLFVDYSSAFNTIIPDILITKLTTIGLPPLTCAWIRNFLTNRPQTVRLGPHRSSTRLLSTGSPQGCVLSPLLYSLYTNDCSPTHNNLIVKFSDDTTVVGLISKENNLTLNTGKTKEIIVNFRKQNTDPDPLYINGQRVERVHSFRFLGLLISDSISWSENINAITKKGSAAAALPESRIEEEKQATERKKRKEEEERKREEEEKRRQKELEKTRIIQEQVDRENKASLQDLSQALEALRQEQSLRARQQQQSQVLQHILKGPAAHVDRDELGDVQGQFEELLSMYEITEYENSTSKLEDRMKTLQNELTLTYLGDHKNPAGSLWALDQATGYVDLSLTERFSVLEAVVKFTLERDADLEDPTTGQDKKIEFLFNLQDQLHLRNPTLARRVLVEMTSQLAGDCREMLSLILFNNIWTPTEIKHFIGRISSMHQETVKQILHEVCTYKLGCSLVLAALDDKDPVGYIQNRVSSEVDKDIITILDEMRDNNYPEQVLSQLHNILQYVSEALSRSPDLTITTDLINSGKRQMMSLDLSQPSAHSSLKKILLVLSLALKECTTFVTTTGEEVRGYFPRLTQLASLLLLLLPQVQDERGCLLEIGTGEGKTCILAMFATIQAVRGLAVDIVTSSPLLAIRDQEVWQKLYSMFGVTSSTVPPPHQKSSSSVNRDKALEDAYRKQVVYGTVSTFAADILRQEFEKNRTRGDRRFECVVVDEVDYMTLDSGVEVTYLSHQASGLRHVEQVLAAGASPGVIPYGF
ncbi:uncharacterized protein LOC133456429 [Cololabis saira]|uniref:uncharacterized protein LOC133456429 n=1 Tax=Cololabis saira TaxID=129043 RepID=UPI002AD26AB7|nr:uncharacterized protein LOC133456429 [Cololabis saira]